MRLGHIQKNILSYLRSCPVTGGCICSTTKAVEFRGYDYEQVERALNSLLKRNIIRKEGIRYILMEEKNE